MSMQRRSIQRIAAYGAALLVLLAVFAMYLQADFMVTLAQQLWACF